MTTFFFLLVHDFSSILFLVLIEQELFFFYLHEQILSSGVFPPQFSSCLKYRSEFYCHLLLPVTRDISIILQYFLDDYICACLCSVITNLTVLFHLMHDLVSACRQIPWNIQIGFFFCEVLISAISLSCTFGFWFYKL